MQETQSGNAAIQREKYWQELTPEQKIERLAERLHEALVANSALSRQIANLQRDMGRHAHGAHGEVLKPIYDGYGEGNGVSGGIARFGRSPTWGIRPEPER